MRAKHINKLVEILNEEVDQISLERLAERNGLGKSVGVRLFNNLTAYSSSVYHNVTTKGDALHLLCTIEKNFLDKDGKINFKRINFPKNFGEIQYDLLKKYLRNQIPGQLFYSK